MEKKVFNIESLEIKRFYFDGKLVIKCPSCKVDLERDFSSDYLSYPSFTEAEDISFYCDDCEKEYILPVNMKNTIEITYDLKNMK